MLYVAYGSNMNIEQMKYRCPDAKVIGTGIIPHYMLMFRGRAESAVATIQKDVYAEKDKNVGVPVVVWEISPRDERSLDIYEGYPRLYVKKNINVLMSSGETLEAMVYIMNSGYKSGLPSENYFNTILEGYFDNELDVEYLFSRLEAAKGFLGWNGNNS